MGSSSIRSTRKDVCSAITKKFSQMNDSPSACASKLYFNETACPMQERVAKSWRAFPNCSNRVRCWGLGICCCAPANEASCGDQRQAGERDEPAARPNVACHVRRDAKSPPQAEAVQQRQAPAPKAAAGGDGAGLTAQPERDQQRQSTENAQHFQSPKGDQRNLIRGWER